MKPSFKNRAIMFGLVFLSLVLMGTGFVMLHTYQPKTPIGFHLQDHHGRDISAESLSDKSLLVFFGFTYCSKICPTQMVKLSAVIDRLDAMGYAEDLIPIFITIDPERDTPARISEYLSNFHERFIGLTGSDLALREAALSFRIVMEQSYSEDDANKEISHSSIAYLVGPDSDLLGYVPAEVTIENAVYLIGGLLTL